MEQRSEDDHFSATKTGGRQGTVTGQIHEKLTIAIFCCVTSFTISCNKYMVSSETPDWTYFSIITLFTLESTLFSSKQSPWDFHNDPRDHATVWNWAGASHKFVWIMVKSLNLLPFNITLSFWRRKKMENPVSRVGE